MFGIINFSVFIITGIILNITPGADTMYILGNSMSGGKKSGVMSALGISSGCIVHTVLAALFFLAFLPQFINPNNTYGALPFLLLELTFITTGTIWCIMLAVFSSYITGKIGERMGISNFLNKITGFIFVALGLNLLRAKLANR